MKNTIVEVEIGRTDDNVQFAIESERKNSTLKNETKLIQKESIVNGISRFILKPNVTTNGGISISFFRTPTTGKVINNYSTFLIKYQVANAEEKLPSFKYDREIKVELVELKEKEIIIIADNIVKNSETYWVRYYLRIYNKTDNFVLSKIDNLFEEANPSVTPLVDKQIDLIKTNDNMTYIEQLSSLSEEFYITISSNFRSFEKNEFKLGFEPKYVSTKPTPTPKPDEPKKNNWFLIVLITVAVVVVVLFIGGCLYHFNKKKKQLNVIDIGSEGLMEREM